MLKIQPGSFMFTNKLSSRPSGGITGTLKEQAICLILGFVDKKAPPIPDSEFVQLLGEVGLVTITDVEEILGKTACNKLEKVWKAKYLSSPAPVLEAKPKKNAARKASK